jgi:hypothetical protein
MTFSLHAGRGTIMLAVVAVLVAATATTVTAQSNPQAEALFRQGRELLKQGKISEACESFEASQRLETGIGTLLNLADCRAKNGQLATAWALFLRAAELAQVTPNEERRAKAARRFAAELEPRLPYLTVSVPDDSKVDGLEITLNGDPLDRGLWNVGVPMDPGQHVVEGQAPGHEPWSTTVTVEEAERRSVEVPRFKRIQSLTAPLGVASTGAGSNQLADAPDGGMPPLRKAAVGVGAAGAVGLAASAVFGLQARSKWNDAQEQQDDGLRKQAETRATLSTASAVVGVACVGTAVTLWILGKPEGGRVRTAVLPASEGRGATISLSARF